MEQQRPLQSISDDELLRRLAELLSQSRRVEADVVAHIGEVDERKLYAREASPSMYAYCTEILHLSEAEAYLRITVARAAREHPMLLTMLGDGRLHLTGLARLVPHLTRDNRDTLLKRATHRSKREILELIAELAPRPDAPAVMRKVRDRKILPESALRIGAHGVVVASELRPDGVEPSVKLRLDGVEPSLELRLDGEPHPSAAGIRTSPPPTPNCVRTESALFQLLASGGTPSFSPWHPLGTGYSSRPARSFETSWSACGRSCAQGCPTEIWARSSNRP